MYHTLGPVLKEMREDIATHENEGPRHDGGYTCGGTEGWRHAVYLDMTDPNTNCLSGWNMTGYSKRTYGRATDGFNTCDSVLFPVSGAPYIKVCGRIRAYQKGVPDAFRGESNSIDSAYISGVAITHGSPRQHIWTFVVGAWENDTTSSPQLSM